MTVGDLSDKARGMAEELPGQVTGDAGQELRGRGRQVAADMRSSAGDVSRTAKDAANRVTAGDLIAAFAPLENLSPSTYVAAMLASIAISIWLFMTGRTLTAIFVGLWAPTFLNLGQYLKQQRPSRNG